MAGEAGAALARATAGWMSPTDAIALRVAAEFAATAKREVSTEYTSDTLRARPVPSKKIEWFAAAAFGKRRAPDACGWSSVVEMRLAAPPTPMKCAMQASPSVGSRPTLPLSVKLTEWVSTARIGQ